MKPGSSEPVTHPATRPIMGTWTKAIIAAVVVVFAVNKSDMLSDLLS